MKGRPTTAASAGNMTGRECSFRLWSTRQRRYRPVKYPARQTLEASEAVARLHQLDPRYTVFAPARRRRLSIAACFITTSSRSAIAMCCSTISRRLSIRLQCWPTLRAKSDSLDIPFTSVEVPDERVSPRRRRGLIPVQQPAAEQTRRQDADRGAGGVPPAGKRLALSQRSRRR